MKFQDGFFADEESGIEYHGAKPAAIMALIRGGSDEQILGMLARILRDAKITSGRASKILGMGRTRYYELVATPFPGINDKPEPVKKRRPKPTGMPAADAQ